MKYGLLSYETYNIGDDIQSIAATRFLPAVDTLFDRDNINKTTLKNPTKLIMNGWYTHGPKNWPPESEKLRPLLISMYIEQYLDKEIPKSFLNKKSVFFLNKWGPVGARDYATLDFLKQNGIDAYFSGCLTLTLQKIPNISRQDFILTIGVPQEIIKKIKRKTSREIIDFDTLIDNKFSADERFAIAKYYLYLYQSAHMVITTRLHCMLPCLALETPVISLSKKEPYRYSGLIDLTNHYSFNEFLDSKIDYENPNSNPKQYLPIRKNLITKAASFTGFDSSNSFLGQESLPHFLTNPTLLSAIAKAFSKSGNATIENIALKNKVEVTATEYEKTIQTINAEKEELKAKLKIAQNPDVRTSLRSLRQAINRKYHN